MLTKVVYNACHGGFSLSLEALERMQELGFKGETYVAHEKHVALYDCARHNPILVQAVEELGPKAGGIYADLRIALVAGPYRIEEYDGSETVYEPNDYDWITP
jgi:hypothetical protein